MDRTSEWTVRTLWTLWTLPPLDFPARGCPRNGNAIRLADCAALIRSDAAAPRLTGGTAMNTINANTNAHVLFRTHDILVTPAMARFGPVSYQVAAISSVALYHRPKLNPFAVALALAAVALAAFAYFAREEYPDYSLWSTIAAPVALILGVAWQRFRPILEYQFVMRTAGNETETVTSFDRDQVCALREAIETAFHLPRVEVEHIDTIRMEPPEPPHRHSDEGLHITRDWVVANGDIAPR
jgi:hypothetical protein